MNTSTDGSSSKSAVVLHQRGHESRLLLHLLAALPQHRLVDIADVCDLAVRFGGEAVHDRVAATADADTGHADLVVGGKDSTVERQSQSRAERGRLLKEHAASGVRHDRTSSKL